MHDDYTPRYLTYLIARLYEQIEDKSTIEILTKYLDYTDGEAKEALKMLKSLNCLLMMIESVQRY